MLDGSGNVAYLPVASDAQNPDAFLHRVLEGWERAQRASDFSPNTIRTRRAVVINLVDFSGHYPWEVVDRRCRRVFRSRPRREEFFALNGSRLPGCDQTVLPLRLQPAIRLVRRVRQVVRHRVQPSHYRAESSNPLTTQRDPAGEAPVHPIRVAAAVRSGRPRGGQDPQLRAARRAERVARDSVASKTAYAWGLRSNELRHLQVVDLSRGGGVSGIGGHNAAMAVLQG